jgi:hypothetical protein
MKELNIDVTNKHSQELGVLLQDSLKTINFNCSGKKLLFRIKRSENLRNLVKKVLLDTLKNNTRFYENVFLMKPTKITVDKISPQLIAGTLIIKIKLEEKKEREIDSIGSEFILKIKKEFINNLG